jgi:hypothetical protein
MKIHLNRGGQSLGQFTPEQVRTGYSEGKFTASDLAWREGMATWRPLGEVVDDLAPTPGTEDLPPLPPVAASGLPWENRSEVGFFPALLETVRQVLLEPKAAFASMRQTGGLGAPLFFFVLVGSIGGAAGMLYQVVFNSLQQPTTPEEEALVAMFASTAAIGFSIMLLPVLFVVVAFVTAGLVHLSLIIVGGAKRPFEATFRVACYAGGSTAILQLLPVCGALVSSVWNFVCMIVGLSEVHGIGKGRAAFAVLLPSVVCCGLILAGVFALLAAFGGSLNELIEAAGAQAP